MRKSTGPFLFFYQCTATDRVNKWLPELCCLTVCFLFLFLFGGALDFSPLFLSSPDFVPGPLIVLISSAGALYLQ